MTWRTVIISSNCKLEYKLEYLIIRSNEIRKIHLSEIAVLMIESTAVSLTAALMIQLVNRKIKVIYCDEKRQPCCELCSYYGSHDCSGKLREQIQWSEEAKKSIWAEIVKMKISRQRDLLKKRGFDSAARHLGIYATEVEIGDTTNREGHAAKVYFNCILDDDTSRRDENAFNSCLDYGYAIILSAVSREIVASGYNTQLGIFHDNKFNHFNLASDLMEPFRPLVDELALEIDAEELTPVEKHQLVDVLNKYVTIDGKSNTVLTAIGIYVRSVFDAIENNDPTRVKSYEA